RLRHGLAVESRDAHGVEAAPDVEEDGIAGPIAQASQRCLADCAWIETPRCCEPELEDDRPQQVVPRALGPADEALARQGIEHPVRRRAVEAALRGEFGERPAAGLARRQLAQEQRGTPQTLGAGARV